MNNINQYYEILGLKPGVSLEEVKQAYKDLAMVCHPDRFPNNPRLREKAQEELKRINAAYDVLKSGNFSSSNQGSSPKSEPSSSTDAIFYYERGMDKAKRGRYQEAIEDFSHALRIKSNYAEAYKYRGLAYLNLETTKKQLKTLKKLPTYIYSKEK